MTLFAMAALLVLSGTFSGSETAVFSLRPGQRRRVERASAFATAALGNPGGLLVALLLGNLFVNVAYFSLSAWLASRLVADGRQLAGAAVSLGSLLAIVVAGEIVPKTLALKSAEPFVRRAVPLLWGLRIGLAPLVVVAEALTRLIEGLVMGDRERPAEVDHGDFKSVVTTRAAMGTYRQVEMALLHDVVDIGTRRARSLMVPRVDVVFLDVNEPIETWWETMARHPHADYPVCDGALDRLLGMVSSARLYAHRDRDRRALLEPATYIPMSLEAHRIVALMRRTGARVAVVLDEYGGVAGIVGLSTLAADVLGEVRPRDAAEPLILPRSGGGYVVAGACTLQQLEEEAKIDLPARRASSVGGVIVETSGVAPRRGLEVVIGGWRARVLEVRGRRVGRVLLRPAHESGVTGAALDDVLEERDTARGNGA